MDPSPADKNCSTCKALQSRYYSYVALLGYCFGQDVAWPDGLTEYGETVYPEKRNWKDSSCMWKRIRLLCMFIYLFIFHSLYLLVPIVVIISDTFYFTGNISGRDSAFLEQHLEHLKNVGFSAEHGGFFRERKSNKWSNFTKSLDMSRISEVEEIVFQLGFILRYVCSVFVSLPLFFVVRNVYRGRREVISKWRKVR